MSEDSLIAPFLADFISAPVMMVVSTRDSRFRATIGRGSGAVYDAPTGLIDFFVSKAQWPEVCEFAVPGGMIATTYVRPTDYLCYQIKGVIADMGPATDTELARAKLYVERVMAVMETINVKPAQLTHSLCVADLVRVGFHPSEVFTQTPGPGAGARISPGTGVA